MLESRTGVEYRVNELEIDVSVRNNLVFVGSSGHFLHGYTIVFFFQKDNGAHSSKTSKIELANRPMALCF